MKRFVAWLLLALTTSSALAGPIILSGGRPTSGAIDVQADWTLRTTDALYGENFSGFANTTALRDHESITNPTRLSLSTEHALSGKSAMVTTLSSDNEVSHGAILALDGVRQKGTNNPESVFDEVYAQVIVWTDDYVNWPFKSSEQNAPKFFILDRAPQCDICSGYSPSGNPGEIVIDNQSTHGFVHAYRVCTHGSCNGNFTPFERGQATPLNGSNFARQNAVDRMTTVTTEASARRRYGPTYSGMLCDDQDAGTPLTTQCPGFPDPDAAIGGIAWNRGGFTVVEIYANYNTDTVLIWAAHYGDEPLLIIDGDLSGDGAAFIDEREDIDGWSGFTLTNFRTSAAADMARPEMYTWYPEVIIKLGDGTHDPGDGIPFPGGHELP